MKVNARVNCNIIVDRKVYYEGETIKGDFSEDVVKSISKFITPLETPTSIEQETPKPTTTRKRVVKED